jgi:hypothetical protein
VSRRSVLLGTVALGTAACTPYSLGEDQRRAGRTPTPSPEPEPRTDPDVALAATVLAAEQDLLDRVERTLAAHPRLRRLLGPTRDGHAAHVDLLAEAAPKSPAPSASPSGSAEPLEGSAAHVPRDAGRAVRALARAEDELGAANRTGAFSAESGAFARVLASMAAAAAQQSVVLGAASVPGSRR